SNAQRRPLPIAHGSPGGRSPSQKVTFAAILPGTNLITIRRAYTKKIQDAADQLTKGRHIKYNFTNYFRVIASVEFMSLNPSPTEILKILCSELLKIDVSTIIYMTNSEVYGHNAASAQYLMQLTGYLGIPVIAWNTDNVGLEQQPKNTNNRCDHTMELRKL
ncbi:glutamate receptor ionotropic: NMDA 2B-like protein, partial [Dinothrombium tinctorium]